MSFAQLFTVISGLIGAREAQQAHHVFHYYQDLVRAYGYVRHMPIHIQAAWLGTVGVVILLHYDAKIALAAERPNAPFPPAAIRPLH